MKENNKYLLKIWVPIFILWILLFSVGLFKIKQGDSSLLVILIVVIVGSVVFRRWARVRTKQRIELLLRDESPQSLIDYYKKNLKSSQIQDQDAWLANSEAFAYVIYGEFEKAKEILKRVNWEKKIPLIQALEFYICALIHYLKPIDYHEGLRLSIKAQEMKNVSDKFPGVKMSKSFGELYVELGNILVGNVSKDVILNMEDRFENSLTMLDKIVVAWGLANAYRRLNLVEKSEEMLAYCKAQAPYCRPLHDMR